MKTIKSQLNNRKPIIRLFSAVLFLMGFTFVVSSCCKEDMPNTKPEKVVIMFGTDSGEGSLKVTVNGAEIASRTEIKKGETVIFKAIHSKSWQIKYWMINGTIIRSLEPTQTFENVTEHMDVRVAFKEWISTPSE